MPDPLNALAPPAHPTTLRETTVTARDPKAMSQRELEGYLDELVASGADEQPSPEFERAFAEWERRA